MIPALTRSEREVLMLAAEGLNNKEIGRRCFRSTSSVKSYLSSAYRKIGAANRAEAVAWLRGYVCPRCGWPGDPPE